MVEDKLCIIRNESYYCRGVFKMFPKLFSDCSEHVTDIVQKKTTEETVLEAARTYKSEDKFSLLVYASDKAMSWERQPLPKALEVCVLLEIPILRV